MSLILTEDTFDIWIKLRALLEGWWFDPWQDNFKYFIGSMYKKHFEKPNIELLRAHLSALLEIVNSIYIFPVYTCALSPGPLRRMQFSNAYTLRRIYSVHRYTWLSRTTTIPTIWRTLAILHMATNINCFSIPWQHNCYLSGAPTSPQADGPQALQWSRWGHHSSILKRPCQQFRIGF